MASSKSRGCSDENGKVFVLQNIPADFSEDLDYIRDYVEGKLDIDVKEVQLHPLVPGRALVYLEQQLEDFSEAEKKIGLFVASRGPAVVVNDLDTEKLSEEFLCLYFESEFADGGEVIEYSKTWPELKMAIVHFYPNQLEVVENILENSDLVPLPSEDYHITIQPFYHNFHKYIEQLGMQNEGFKTTAEENESFVHGDNGEIVKEEEEKEMAKKEDVEEEESDMEVEESEEEESEEEESEVEDNEVDKEVKGKKNKKSCDDDETDDDEEGNPEDEDRNTNSVINQGCVRGHEKVSPQRGSLPIIRGFRGRGMGRMQGGLTEPSRGGSCAKESERNKANTSISNEDRMSTLYDKQHLANEDGELESRREIKLLGRDNMRGGKGAAGDLKLNYGSLSSYGPTSNESTMDEESFIKRGAKQHNYRGRGGTAFIPGGARSIHSKVFVNDNCDMSKNQDHGDHLPRSSTMDFHYSKSDENKEHNTDLESLRSYGQEPTVVHQRVSENTTNVGQSLPEKNSTFQKTQLEYKDRYLSEIAAKEAKIKQLEEELANRKEQPKQYIERVKMTAWQKEFLPDCFGTFPDCFVQYDHQENVATLDGQLDSVRDHHLKLLKELKKLKEELLALTPAMFSILSKEQGKQYLNKLNLSQLKGAKTFLQNESLLVAAKDDESLNFAMDFLKSKVNYKETIKLDAKIPTEKLHFERSELENKFLVKVSWSDNNPTIVIEGIKDDVFESSRNIAAVIEEHGFQDKSFDVTGSLARFFYKNLENQIRQYLQGVETVDFVFTEAQVSIQFKGDRRTVNQIHRNLTLLKTKVTTKSWDLKSEFKNPEDLMLITNGFSGEKFKRKIENFETNNKCVIVTKLPILNFTVSKKKQPTHSTPKDRWQFETFAAPKQVETKQRFTLTNTCHLVVKPYGDITKESSDVLVCVLAQNIDLRRTRVGQTFNRVCPTLRKILQAEHIAHPDDPVLTTTGILNPLKCQAICHIIFNPWDPNTSPAVLSSSIQLVISKAVALGAKSVSFPVLGCGRAFGFPPSDVAQITLSSIKSSNLGNTIQKVVLLAPDTELYKELKNEAPKHFQAVPVTVEGAVGGATPDETITDETDAVDESDESEESERDEPIFEVEPLDSQNMPEISIVALHDSGIEALWSSLKKEIAKVCLHTDYFNQEITDFWPPKSSVIILQEAKKLCVWVKISPNPKTKKPGYIVKGTKQDVKTVLSVISKEFNEFSSHMPKKRIKSHEAPKRGTQEFFKHAANSDELFPSYWKLNSKSNKSLWNKVTDRLRRKSDKHSFLVDIDPKTKNAITKLISKTFDPNIVGFGNDAHGLNHRGIKVIDVKRIENLQLFEVYSMQRQSLFRRMIDGVIACPDIGTLNGSKGRVVTTEHLEKFMKEELYYEVNEHYLFHGTKCPDAICSNGIDPRVSNEAGMFGRGIYTAEMFTKADQYTDSRTERSHPGKTLNMILARVLLGNVFLCNDQHKSVISKQSVKLTRPPCINCLEDKCNCKNQTLFDSVMGDGKWYFREFVVYEKYHCYPEYLISYQRV